MKNKSQRAKAFIATRKHHLLETAEDYVEIISDLITAKGQARTCDIAEQLGISHVTVINTVKRLEKKGYLQTESHQPVVLTKDGAQLATFCKQRHQFLLSYLKALGVPEEIAEVDVEGIEHHIHPKTLEAFQNHLELILQLK